MCLDIRVLARVVLSSFSFECGSCLMLCDMSTVTEGNAANSS